MRSRNLINKLFEPIYNKRIFELQEKLKDIAIEYVPPSSKDAAGKKGKGKKKKAAN